MHYPIAMLVQRFTIHYVETAAAYFCVVVNINVDYTSIVKMIAGVFRHEWNIHVFVLVAGTVNQKPISFDPVNFCNMSVVWFSECEIESFESEV